MKKMREEFRIELPGVERPAKVIVRRIGQQLPSLGDGVVAEAAILLPAEDGRWLAPELRFEDRLTLAGEGLSSWWGRESRDEEARKKEKEFTGSTWAEAFALARKWAEGELARLVDALIRRRKALEMAEDE